MVGVSERLSDCSNLSKFQMRKATGTGDGNCLFYSLLRENNLQSARQLRHDLAGWMQAHPEYQMEGMSLELWVSHQFVRANATPSVSTYA